MRAPASGKRTIRSRQKSGGSRIKNTSCSGAILGTLRRHFKKVERFWSVRVGLRHRALAVEESGTSIWFWIGSHDEYDCLIRSQR